MSMIQENKEQRLYDTIKKKYNQKQQLLSLSCLPDQWVNILRIKNWQDIKVLFLEKCRITDTNSKIISEFNSFKIRSLWLSFNQLMCRGVYQIFKQGWDCLQYLKLSQNKIGDSGLQFVLKRELPCLKKLEINYCNITSNGLKFFKDYKVFNLTSIDISRNNLGQTGVNLLIKSDIPKLQSLFIHYCNIGSEGAKCLTKGKWPQIKFMNISGNYIGLQGYTNIYMGKWVKLQMIYLQQVFDCLNFSKIAGIEIINMMSLQTKPRLFYKIQNKNINSKIKKIVQRKNKQIQNKGC